MPHDNSAKNGTLLKSGKVRPSRHFPEKPAFSLRRSC